MKITLKTQRVMFEQEKGGPKPVLVPAGTYELADSINIYNPALPWIKLVLPNGQIVGLVEYYLTAFRFDIKFSP